MLNFRGIKTQPKYIHGNLKAQPFRNATPLISWKSGGITLNINRLHPGKKKNMSPKQGPFYSRKGKRLRQPPAFSGDILLMAQKSPRPTTWDI